MNQSLKKNVFYYCSLWCPNKEIYWENNLRPSNSWPKFHFWVDYHFKPCRLHKHKRIKWHSFVYNSIFYKKVKNTQQLRHKQQIMSRKQGRDYKHGLSSLCNALVRQMQSAVSHKQNVCFPLMQRPHALRKVNRVSLHTFYFVCVRAYANAHAQCGFVSMSEKRSFLAYPTCLIASYSLRPFFSVIVKWTKDRVYLYLSPPSPSWRLPAVNHYS